MKNRQLRHQTILSFFIIIEIVISLVPFLGFIPLGFINATTLHLPVIIAGILLGKKEGMIVGFVFGLLSLAKATFTPNLTSFIFSPFVTIGTTSGQWYSLIIVFVPRIIMGYVSGLCMEKIRFKAQNLTIGLSAFVSSLTNTILVFFFILLFFKDSYAAAVNQPAQMLLNFLGGLLASVGVIEAIIAIIFAIPLYRALKPMIGGNTNV